MNILVVLGGIVGFVILVVAILQHTSSHSITHITNHMYPFNNIYSEDNYNNLTY